MGERLIVFYKNPIAGKVKTRLARKTTPDYALKIYEFVSEHTSGIIQSLPVSTVIYYSQTVITDDLWDKNYDRELQKGPDLGARMKNAFEREFTKGFERIGIVGSDIYPLSADAISGGFSELDHHDLTLGPALDGGYYFLGMKKHHPGLFDNIPWSTPKTLERTRAAIHRLELEYYELPTLRDIDTWDDVVASGLNLKVVPSGFKPM